MTTGRINQRTVGKSRRNAPRGQRRHSRAASFYTRHQRSARTPGPTFAASTTRALPLLSPSRPHQTPPAAAVVYFYRRELTPRRTPFAKAADTCVQSIPDRSDGSTRDLKPRPPLSVETSQRTDWQPDSTLGYPNCHFPESIAQRNRRREARAPRRLVRLTGCALSGPA